MKRIKLYPPNAEGNFGSTVIITNIVTLPSGQEGIKTVDMRKRLRILDVVENVLDGADHLDLEDADSELLKDLASKFQFGVAHRDIMAVLDAIDKPTDIPKEKAADKTAAPVSAGATAAAETK